MPPVHHATVAVRRLIGRHPWVHWLAVAMVAVAVAATVLDHGDRVSEAREQWGRAHPVWVTRSEVVAGEPLDAERRTVPAAVVPPGAVDAVDGRLARQHIGAGEIITEIDVARDVGPASLVPDGWLGVPVDASPGLAVGDRVQVVSDGFVVGEEALVVAVIDEAILLAAPADQAPAIAAASDASGLTLLLEP